MSPLTAQVIGNTRAFDRSRTSLGRSKPDHL